MTGNMPYLSLAAAALYALVALAAMVACGTAAKNGQPGWNRNVWFALAMMFVALVVWRGLGIEDALREWMRGQLRAEGSYSGRYLVQGIIVSIVAAMALFGGLWAARRSAGLLRGRRNIATVAALAAGAAMAVLIALRLISLHLIDGALYGPLKLNWFGDIGSSLAVLIAAIYYVRLVRARP